MSALTKYIHPAAYSLLQQTFRKANLQPVIVQTMSLGGNDAVSASAGTHNQSGKYKTLFGWRPYGVCVDFSVHQLATRLSDKRKVEMNESRIKWFLYNLSTCLTIGWYRTPDEGFKDAHIHVVTASVKMDLEICQNQVIDFVNDRTGLKGHREETFWTASAEHDDEIARAFMKANPVAIPRMPQRFTV